MQTRKLLFLLPAILLCACSRNTTDSSQTETLPPAAVAETMPQVSETPDETAQTAPIQQPPTETFTVPQSTELAVTRYTVPAQTDEPLYQGGEGDEAHAQTPAPEYFTYRFSPDGISVRLAGGSYQILLCDLSASIGSGIEMLYQLPDCNFDGQHDLLVPVTVSDSDITYAAFCWNAERAAFAEVPVFLQNPIIHPETEQIICLKQENDTTACVTVRHWENGTLTEIQHVTADYDSKQLVTDDGIKEFDTDDALTEALLEYYH